MTDETEDPREEAKKKLVGFGSDVLDNINNGEPPRMVVPSRSTSNIIYDEDARFYTLGDKKTTRTAANMRQVKKFAQTMCAAEMCKDLIEADKTAT